jgi:hypothetical protein
VTVAGLRLGAPGVYRTERRPPPAFRPVRLDVVGFVGAAPRGPVDTPVAVESWTDYLWRFGGHEGVGLLPYAVNAFFSQGGVRAYVLRVSPLPRDPDPAALGARARHRVTLGSAPGKGGQDVDLLAADEGSWGGGLVVRWDFGVARRFGSTADGTDVTLPDGVAPPVGALLRVRGPASPVTGSFHWVVELAVRDDGPGVRRRVAVVDRAPVPSAAAHPVDVDIVGTTVTVADSDPAVPREERLSDLGLRRGHPRFACDVLAAESRLVVPSGTWPDELLPPDEFLTSAVSRPIADGMDRWTSIRADSFLGSTRPESLPVGGDEGLDDSPPVHGVDRMSLVAEIGLLSVPDLLWSTTVPRAVVDLVPPRRPPHFAPCVPDPPPVVYRTTPPDMVRLDARTELAEVQRRQLHVVALAERQRRFVALLDVPERLPVRAVARWRASFDSSYAAAYHPWLGVVRPDDPTRQAVLVPPSAFAAGILADRERRLGIPWGPANELAAAAVIAAETLTDAVADELHLLDVDTFRVERDGFRLSSARTLSLDPDYRHLSVRRLMTMLRLVLERQAQWIVFEPHTELLRRALRRALIELLRDLFRGGAFAGTTEAESFFVRCDESLNPAWSQGLGRLVAEVGVAPSQPLEYLVLRISQDTDGVVGVEG